MLAESQFRQARDGRAKPNIRGIVAIVVSTCFLSGVEAGATARLIHAPGAPGEAIVYWNSQGPLETAAQVTEPWLTITTATNSSTNAITIGAQFFRLNQTVDATTLRKKVLCGYQG